MAGDKALEAGAGDRLGFTEPAKVIAKAIQRQKAVEGLVIGIEGRWGSGKSSLVNIVADELRRKTPTPEIVVFKPWLIGDRNSLLHALFTDLASAANSIEQQTGASSMVRSVELVGAKMMALAAQLEGVGKLIKLVQGGEVVGEVIIQGSKLSRGMVAKRSISSEKEEVRRRIKQLPRRIVVIIDDVDRLEPHEVVEIMRLVRSVADFPNIAYVLCYDAEIVAKAVVDAARVPDGRKYIEKIVQLSVPVPQPEAFALRHWFKQQLAPLVEKLGESGDERIRLQDVVNHEGGRYLTTPRDVVRCLDSIRFFWPNLEYKVDLADLVWLHLIKIGNPKLYNWIEGYLREEAVRLAGTAQISDEEEKASFAALEDALKTQNTTFASARDRLSDILPGISGLVLDMVRNGKGRRVHAEFSVHAVAEAKHRRRLASPDHYRLYFAFSPPTGAPLVSDTVRFLAALDQSPDDSARLLLEWNGAKNATGMSTAEIMITWYVEAHVLGKNQDLTQARSRALLFALAGCIDELASSASLLSDETELWSAGRHLLREELSYGQDDRKQRVMLLKTLFNGRALGWLTSLFRREMFALGRVEGYSPRGRSIFNTEDLDLVSDIMISRYRSLRLDEWKAQLQPLSALFAWLQAGDQKTVKQWMSQQIVTDAGLVEVLEMMGSTVVSSHSGQHVSLKRENLEPFMNHDDVRSRLDALAMEPCDTGLQERARVLIERLDVDKG